jgi:hypothetical protein
MQRAIFFRAAGAFVGSVKADLLGGFCFCQIQYASTCAHGSALIYANSAAEILFRQST